MLALIQRVTQATVLVDGRSVGAIDEGILALIGIEKNDTPQKADHLLNRLLNYRIFSDSKDKMNLSLQDIDGGLLLVPQFTLAADTKKGLRPSFAPAAPPALSESLFDYLLSKAQQDHPQVASGLFAADMQIQLINNGPVTFSLQN